MTIRIYVRDNQPGVHRQILEAIPQPYHRQIDDVICVKRSEIPKAADFVLHCGHGRPTTAAEGFAATRGTFLVCMPEATSWFQEKFAAKVAAGADVVVLDAGLHKVLRVI
ncbi:hypothetical protein [Amycolatopsis kentuckyensis]|uniref:hypothetical protein n=1 Tax=Amycolatopsis kentuckyensis TaxID=218823 RepID=UPI000A3A024F|nr:hypothetical protein [Amycolatopsis kentuckyensis]